MKHLKVLYPGSFDPVTLGHMNIIRRGSQMFDDLVVAVAFNSRKQSMFSRETRVEFLNDACAEFANVRIVSYDGMTVQYAREIHANALLRGVRNPADFHSEFQMAITNRTLAPELETIFFASDPAYTFINSYLVREIANSGGDISSFVPEKIMPSLRKILEGKRGGTF